MDDWQTVRLQYQLLRGFTGSRSGTQSIWEFCSSNAVSLSPSCVLGLRGLLGGNLQENGIGSGKKKGSL